MYTNFLKGDNNYISELSSKSDEEFKAAIEKMSYDDLESLTDQFGHEKTKLILDELRICNLIT
ncbi:MAG: hypothetical protein GY830_03155 [Bacteroidetes bacterium]|nr:hypothetical protein [Bacteroidota bacterium]